MKEKETNNTQALSEEDLEKVSGGYLIHHDRTDDMFNGDTGNLIETHWDSANSQKLSLEEFKKLQEANR